MDVEATFRLAELLAAQSKDPNRKVGAILAPLQGSHICGYNNPAWKDEEAFDFTRPDKNQWMVHAELDVLLFCGLPRSRGSTMFVTSQPCHECAKHIIAGGVARVLWLEDEDATASKWRESWAKAEAMFDANDVYWAGYIRTKNTYTLRRERTKFE